MIEKLTENYKNIISLTEKNPEREGLKNTPERAAKAIKFLTSGYQTDIRQIVNNALFKANTDEMIIIGNIEFYSLCEHHLLPFIGSCHIGYIPNKKILGLSKFARIVNMFARRFQVQENLTQQIADAVMNVTDAQGVGVALEAKHMCMLMRGVEKQQGTMTTSVMLGAFRDNNSTRQEFMQYITKR